MATQKTRSVEDAIMAWERAGSGPDEINRKLKNLGINPDDIDAALVDYLEREKKGELKKGEVLPTKKMRVRFSVAETIESLADAGWSNERIRNKMFRHGIYAFGPENITEDQLESPLPAQKINLNPAERSLLGSYEKDRASGLYKDWKFGSKRPVSERVARASVAKSGLDYDKVSAWVEAKLDFDNQGLSNVESMAESQALFDKIPELNKRERDLASKIIGARKSLSPWRGHATGTFVGGVGMLARAFGIERKSSADSGVVDFFQDLAAQSLESALTPKRTEKNQAWVDIGYRLSGKKPPVSDLPKSGRLLKETKDGKRLLNITLKRRKEALNALQDAMGLDEPFGTDAKSLAQAFGVPDKEGRIRKKGWFDAKGNEAAKKQLQIIQNTMKVEERLKTEKEFADFGAWLDAAMPEPLKVNAEEQARMARRALDEKFRGVIKTHPGTWARIGNEMYEIMEGLVGITSYVAQPGRGMAVNQLSDLVAAGKMTVEEAQQIVDEQGFAEGAAMAPGLLAYMAPFINPMEDGGEALRRQIQAEPVSFFLSALPALHVLRGMKAAGAARALQKTKNAAKKAGFTDAQILEITKSAEKVARNAQTGYMRQWFDTFHGRHVGNKFLGAIDKYKVPEMVGSGLAVGLAVAPVSEDLADVAVVAGMGAGFRGIREGIKSSARARNLLEETTAQVTPSGQVVTEDLVVDHEAARGIQASLGSHGSWLIKRQREFIAFARRHDIEPTEKNFRAYLDSHSKAPMPVKTPEEALGSASTDLAAATEYAAKSRAAVANDPRVIEAKRLYDEAVPASVDKATKRIEYLNARSLALSRFVEGDGAPSNPGAALVHPSLQYETTINIITEHRNAARIKNEEAIREAEANRDKIYQETVADKVGRAEEKELTRLNKKLEKLRKKEAKERAEHDARVKVLRLEYDRRKNNLEEQVASRVDKPAKGKGRVTRREAVSRAEEDLANFDDTKLKAAQEDVDVYTAHLSGLDLEQLEHLVEGYVRETTYGFKRDVEPDMWSPEGRLLFATTKRERRSLLAAYNRLKREKKKKKKLEDNLAKAKADLEDPGVIVNRRRISYAEARRDLDSKYEADLDKLESDYRSSTNSRSSAIDSLETEIENTRDIAREAIENDVFPESGTGPKWLEASMSEPQRLKARARADRNIERLRQKDAQDERLTQLILDSLGRGKGAEYGRAIQAFDGVHIDDGNYVIHISTPVTLDRRTGRFDQSEPRNITFTDSDGNTQGPFTASEMRSKYRDNEVHEETVVKVGDNEPDLYRDSYEINQPDKVRQPNGFYGTSENFSTSTGSTLARLIAFPASDAEGIVRVLNKFVYQAIADITGTLANGWKKDLNTKAPSSRLKKTFADKKKDIKKSGKVSKDPLSYTVKFLQEARRREVALDEVWADETIKSVLLGQLSDRGVNDIKRLLLDEYGDILLNQGTARALLDRSLRKEFTAFAKQKLKEAGVWPDEKGIKSQNKLEKEAAERRVAQFEAQIDEMAKDYAQGRTLDKWATFGRVNHRFTDGGPSGETKKFKNGAGVETDLTIENLYRDFVAGRLSDDDIIRARQHALLDTIYYTGNALEGRMVVRKVLMDSTGMDKRTWDLGPAHPDHQRVVFKWYLENGDLPPGVRIVENDLGYPVTDPLKNDGAKAVLREVYDDPETKNLLGLTLEEAEERISLDYSNALARDVTDRRSDYVRLGSSADPSNIPGMERVGEGPVHAPSPGLASQHNIIQPEHIGTAVAPDTPGSPATDIFMRREMADSIGWMLDTHADLVLQGAYRFAQGINALFKWGKTAASMLNPLTNFISNNKTHVITQGRTPYIAVGDFISVASMWRKYRRGELEGTPVGKRIEALIGEGFTDATDIIVEVDRTLQSVYANPGDSPWVERLGVLEDAYRGGKIPESVPLVGGKTVKPYRTANEIQEHIYRRYGDELNKMTDALMEWEKKAHDIENMPEGGSYLFNDMDLGAGFVDEKPIGTITKTDDGYAVVWLSGEKKGKVFRVKSLDDGEAATMLAKASMGHASSLYYNLSNVGRGMKAVRRLEALFVTPFQSWRSKALDIPMIKKGMFYRMFIDDIYTISTDPATNMKIYAEAAARAVRRNFWLSVAKDHQEDSTVLREYLPAWAKSAIITGTGANREFFIAESSNPVGGFSTFVQLLAKIEDSIKPTVRDLFDPAGAKKRKKIRLGDKAFWDEIYKRINKEKVPVSSELSRFGIEFFTGGAVMSIIAPAFGINPRTREAYVDGQEGDRFTDLMRGLTPNWLDRLGITQAMTFGAAETGIPHEVIKAMEAEFEWDTAKMATKSEHAKLKSADNVVTLLNILAARRMRKLDPVYMIEVALNIPESMQLRIEAEIERAAKDGFRRDDLPQEYKNSIMMLESTKEAAERHIPRMVRALLGNGASTPKQILKAIRRAKRARSKLAKKDLARAKGWSYNKDLENYLEKAIKKAAKKAAKNVEDSKKEKEETRKLIMQ